jgi:YihY family inner membrane protein
VKRLWFLIRNSAQQFSADNCSQLAAGISFYALFSIVPLALFAVSVFGLVVRDKSVQEDISNQIVDSLNIQSTGFTFDLNDHIVIGLYGQNAPDELRAAIDRMTDREKEDLFTKLDSGDDVTIGDRTLPNDAIAGHSDDPIIDTVRGVARVSGALSVVGLVATAWSASALFASIRRSLNMIWSTDVKRPFAQQKALDLGLVVGFGVLLGASVATTGTIVALRRLSDEALGPLSGDAGLFWSVVPLFVPAFFSFFVFTFLYRYVPNVRTSLRTLWPGVIVATVLFEVLKNGFSIYVEHFTSYDLAYGTLGGVLLFMLWTFLSANILLFGAELAVEYGRMHYGAYDSLPAGPSRPWTWHVTRYVRGLFVQEKTESEHAEAPSLDN